jgi:hypothetical protein
MFFIVETLDMALDPSQRICASWEERCQARMIDTLANIRNVHNKRPAWMSPDIYNQLCRHWRTYITNYADIGSLRIGKNYRMLLKKIESVALPNTTKVPSTLQSMRSEQYFLLHFAQ